MGGWDVDEGAAVDWRMGAGRGGAALAEVGSTAAIAATAVSIVVSTRRIARRVIRTAAPPGVDRNPETIERGLA
jgi:hypothetical protein